MSRQAGQVLRIERSFAASAEDVFDAWTSPEVMRRWFHCAADWATPEAEVDLRVGGKVRVVMRRPGGKEAEAHGRYMLIERPRRLVMAWTFGDDPSNEQLLELSFSESGGSTTVLLINSDISTEERRNGQDWVGGAASTSSSGCWRAVPGAPERLGRPPMPADRGGPAVGSCKWACAGCHGTKATYGLGTGRSQGEHVSFGRPRKARTAASSMLVALALAVSAGYSPAAANGSTSPIHGRSMWIWYLAKSDGGSLPAIVSRARAAGVGTLIIKSSDGGNYWSQFSPSVVRALRASGMQVCAWQYVYGTNPVAEADMGARAVRAGAQCLIIDAEAEYEGRYASAASYLQQLRRLVGRDYPVGLASFPYADYHPAFPYSVFLGPGGAQFDMPQMYWVEIGRGVGTVFHHTYTGNRIYRRPIFPLGQTYGSPLTGDIELFRGLAVRYGSPGISWWDYAWTSAEGFWPALGGLYTPAGASPLGYPVLGPGSKGDEVLWLQEHLAREFPEQRTTGLFGSLTFGLLRAFQSRHRLPVTGSTDTETWRALLRLPPVSTPWAVAATGARRRAGAAPGAAPASASLPAHGYEIPQVGSDRARRGASPAEP